MRFAHAKIRGFVGVMALTLAIFGVQIMSSGESGKSDNGYFVIAGAHGDGDGGWG